MTNQGIAFGVRRWWLRHRRVLLSTTVFLLAVFAVLKLGGEFHRLLWDSGPSGAIDLRILSQLVRQWFAGVPVYDELSDAVHPPSTYAILCPFLGCLGSSAARQLWAVTYVMSLVVLIYLVLQQSGAEGQLERAFVALVPLSMNATGVAIGNGQLTLQVLTALLLAGTLLCQSPRGPRASLALSLLTVLSLVKPTVSLPFLWLIVLRPGGVQTGLLIALGYSGLTAFSASFQDSGIGLLMSKWLGQGTDLAVRGGYGNLHIWAARVGLEKWLLPISLGALLALGVWIYAHRDQELWLLLGVTALVARFWAYHRLYDDLLVLLPMVTLFRMAKQGPDEDARDVVAGLLLAATILAMLLPARLSWAPWPWRLIFTVGHPVVWATVLLFLLYQAQLGYTEGSP